MKVVRLTTAQRIKIVKAFYKNGDLIGQTLSTDIVRIAHHSFAHSTSNIATVRESVAEDPNVSISRRSQELELWHLELYIGTSIKFQLTNEASCSARTTSNGNVKAETSLNMYQNVFESYLKRIKVCKYFRGDYLNSKVQSNIY